MFYQSAFQKKGYTSSMATGAPNSLSAQKYLSWWSVILWSGVHSLWAVPLQVSTFKMPLLSVWKWREMVVSHNCLPKLCSVKRNFFFFFLVPLEGNLWIVIDWQPVLPPRDKEAENSPRVTKENGLKYRSNLSRAFLQGVLKLQR